MRSASGRLEAFGHSTVAACLFEKNQTHKCDLNSKSERSIGWYYRIAKKASKHSTHETI
jgi:hypothetical protein